jgi:hypothetical protein
MLYSPDHLVVVGWVFSSLSLLSPTTLPNSPVSLGSRPTVCDAPTFSLPATIDVEPGLEPVVHWVLEYSPTFRQQCRVLASAPQLSATVRVALLPRGTESRARAVFSQNRSGGLSATIELGVTTDLTELLGHELEHVIERLDGADLPALARRGEARRLPDGAFETRRAITAGQRVSGEVADNAPDRMRRATASIWRVVRRIVRAAS